MVTLALGAAALVAAPASGAAGTGTIAGTLTFAAGGAPSEGIYVCALPAAGGARSCAASGAAGQYAIEGLAPGTYTVNFTGTTCLAPECAISWVPQWWDGAGSEAGATPIVLTAGARVSGIDARLEPVHDPVTEYLEKAEQAKPTGEWHGTLPGAIEPLPVNQRAMEEFWAHPPWQQGSPKAAAPALPLAGRVTPARGGARVSVRCPGPAACAGTVSLLARVRPGARGRHRHGSRAVTYRIAAAKVTLPAGRKRTLTFVLAGTARKLARRAGRSGLAAVVTAAPS